MPDKPRTLVAVGDRSPLGHAILGAALERFDVQAILLPTVERNERFYSRSSRRPPPPPGARWKAPARAAKRAYRRVRPAPPDIPAAHLARRLEWDEVAKAWKVDEFDLLISGGFPAIFPEAVLTRARKRVNVHTSLLPQLKGRHPHYWAVKWGLERSGLTAHEMTLDVDEGPFVGQVVVPLPPGTDYDTHYADLRAAVPELLGQVGEWLETGTPPVEPVDVEPSWSPGEDDSLAAH